MKRIIPIMIILLIAFITGNFAARIFEVSHDYKHNNFETIENVVKHNTTCTPSAMANTTKKVVLRIDDIQEGYMSDVSQRMILDAKKRNMKLVLGVIPKGILEDKELVSVIIKNGCNLEIAQHGWEHAIDGDPNKPEFGNISREEAEKRLALGLKELNWLSKNKITTFIPPQNTTTRETRTAIKNAGFKRISSDGKGKYDFDSSTFKWDTKELETIPNILADCEKAFAEDQKCVIMFHPQDYAEKGKLDKEKYKKYLRLLKEVEKMEAMTVTFQEL